MKSLLTGAFCLMASFSFSQIRHCSSWESIERQLKAYQLSHPVVRKIDIYSFLMTPIIVPTVSIPFRLPGYISCTNPPRTAYTLPPDVAQILKNHPVKTYNACVDRSILDSAKYVY